MDTPVHLYVIKYLTCSQHSLGGRYRSIEVIHLFYVFEKLHKMLAKSQF
jgi:hypothetical protein